MSTKNHWEKAWESADPQSKSWYQDSADFSLELIENCAVALDEAVIDVGGGASVLVDELLRRGFKSLSVLDLSSSALKAAQARLGEDASHVKWLCEDATDWAPAHPFRLWHDRAVFHFLTKAEERALPGDCRAGHCAGRTFGDRNLRAGWTGKMLEPAGPALQRTGPCRRIWPGLCAG